MKNDQWGVTDESLSIYCHGTFGVRRLAAALESVSKLAHSKGNNPMRW